MEQELNENLNKQEEDKRQARKSWLKKFCIFFAAAAVLTVFFAYVFGVFGKTETKDIMEQLCNSFFLTSLIFLGSAGLIFAADEGGFDILKYSIGMLFRMVQKGRFDKYHEYKERVHSKGKTKISHLLVIGGIFMVLSLAFLFISYAF